MTGKYDVFLQGKSVYYNFTVKRKYTVIRGNSATGKSTLVELIRNQRRGSIVKCDVPVRVIPEDGYQDYLRNTSGYIIVIDESFEQLGESSFSHDFEKLLMNSDNYFIIITRKKLSGIPYSVKEIYKLSTREKYLNNCRYESTFSNIYVDVDDTFTPDILVTEDSNSGYQFFKRVFDSTVSAESKSKIVSKLLDLSKEYNNIAVIVDGAAFGSEVALLIDTLSYISSNIFVYALESFEYMLLCCMNEVDKDVLSKTYNYCDAKKFNSWEQFYTFYLSSIMNMRSDNIRYSKFNLDTYFLRYKRGVLHQLSGLNLE